MVEFNNADVKFQLKGKKKVVSLLESVFIKEGKKCSSLSIVFCSDTYLLKINQDFLGHDYFTDVITFDYSKDSESIEGEIFISLDRTKENAVELSTTHYDELVRVMIHGCLHLCGYPDNTKRLKAKIHEREDYYLSLIDIVPRGTPDSQKQ